MDQWIWRVCANIRRHCLNHNRNRLPKISGHLHQPMEPVTAPAACIRHLHHRHQSLAPATCQNPAPAQPLHPVTPLPTPATACRSAHRAPLATHPTTRTARFATHAWCVACGAWRTVLDVVRFGVNSCDRVYLVKNSGASTNNSIVKVVRLVSTQGAACFCRTLAAGDNYDFCLSNTRLGHCQPHGPKSLMMHCVQLQ